MPLRLDIFFLVKKGKSLFVIGKNGVIIVKSMLINLK